MNGGRFLRVLVALCALPLALALALASCSHTQRRAATPGSSPARPRVEVLVTIGSTATFGDGLVRPLSDAWPQLLYHSAFARSTVLVNAADRSATVAVALTQQVPLALEVHATVATVWLGDADLAAGLPVATFEAELDQLVKRLRDSGARVLLGNLATGGSPAAVAYDNAIARVAGSRGATKVDVAAALSVTPKVGPGSSVDAATSRAIARVFASAVASP